MISVMTTRTKNYNQSALERLASLHSLKGVNDAFLFYDAVVDDFSLPFGSFISSTDEVPLDVLKTFGAGFSVFLLQEDRRTLNSVESAVENLPKVLGNCGRYNMNYHYVLDEVKNGYTTVREDVKSLGKNGKIGIYRIVTKDNIPYLRADSYIAIVIYNEGYNFVDLAYDYCMHRIDKNEKTSSIKNIAFTSGLSLFDEVVFSTVRYIKDTLRRSFETYIGKDIGGGSSFIRSNSYRLTKDNILLMRGCAFFSSNPMKIQPVINITSGALTYYRLNENFDTKYGVVPLMVRNFMTRQLYEGNFFSERVSKKQTIMKWGSR